MVVFMIAAAIIAAVLMVFVVRAHRLRRTRKYMVYGLAGENLRAGEIVKLNRDGRYYKVRTLPTFPT